LSVIYLVILQPGDQEEGGEPQWDNIDSRKPLIHPPEHSGNSTTSHLVTNQEDMVREMMNFAYEIISFILVGFFNMP
jgi:hypothetical protein